MKPRPFKLPKYLWLTGKIRWKVQTISAFDDPLTLGLADSPTRTISILKKLKGKKLEEVFWHEVKHAIVKEYRLPVGGDWEESLCIMFERPWANFMRLNNLRFK